MIGPFFGEYRFLSNFYVAPFVTGHGGWEFPTVEHFYQASKAAGKDGFGYVLSAATAGEAKRRGREIALRPGFEAEKKRVMLNGQLLKFGQHPELANLLRATGTEHLEEVNTWGDRFWGTVNGQGENWLGRILMMVRDVVA